ncbi:non-ribosomal peptide synthase/polyketide synthase, partial [Myxococcus sp. RHST-1-4]|nr:non-ribosomal peptide synthase/polyketide synthase [Myxococcus sp. RHSTA-1-4]
LATRLVSRVRNVLHVELPLRTLFEAPTLALLAERIEAAGRPVGTPRPALVPVPRTGDAPLSFAQQRLWFLDRLRPDSAFYNLPAAVRLDGALNVEALERALSELVRRHEVLRSTFHDPGTGPVQRVSPEARVALERMDLSGLPEAEREAEARRLANVEARRPFNLERGPVLRASLLKLDARRHVLLLTLHHIVTDGWSLEVLVREVSALYGAFSEGRPSPLPALPLQYADYAVWQRTWLDSGVRESQLDYWRKQLARLPPLLEMPTDRPRPPIQNFRGTTYTTVLPRALVDGVQALGQREGATPFMVLLAAFQTVLHRYTGQSDFAIGTDIANRHQVETEGLIGFFVNQLVLRTRLEGSLSFRELLARARETMLEASAHQDLPFEELVSALNPERSLAHSPLFQLKLTYQDAVALEQVELPGLLWSRVPAEAGTTKVDLTLSVTRTPKGLECRCEYSTDLFDERTVRALMGHLSTVLAAALERPETPVRDLPLLGAEERRQVLVDWNRTEVAYPTGATVHGLFSAAAARTPEAVAVVAGEHTLTFGELERRSNQLAHHLRSLGVGPEVRVGLFLDRSLELVVGLLGILKAGGAYVPMDASYPAERLAFLARDSGVPVLVTRDDLADLLPSQGELLVCMDSDERALSRQPTHAPETGVTSDCLAYVIYTSGSTGLPKGAMLPHRGVVNYLTWALNAYRVTEGQGAPVHSSVSFDLTVTSLIAPLVAGRPVVLTREEEAVTALAETLRAGNDFSLVKLTPTHLKLLAEQLRPEELAGRTRALVIGGEALNAESLRPWRQYAPKTRLINEYGPTETVVGCVIHEVSAGEPDAGSVSIGRPIANTRLYVLDARLQPVPVGVPGELYVGGDGVGRGYLGRPTLTAERFIPDAFSTTPGARMYRTGDRVVYRADGRLDYLGRLDSQVKLRGFRIELGEIETVLAEHPSVREAAVVLREDTPGARRLVAYVSGEESAEAPSAETLQSFLRGRLPEHMVPAAFVVLDALPLTPNGKVDRQALPAPESTQAAQERPFTAPRNPVEEKLAAIWAQVLGVPRVDIHDNFFERGGDSISGIQMVARARQAGLELTPTQLFENQTIASLARVVSTTTATVEEQGPVTGEMALTPIQRFFFERELPAPHHYNQSVLLVLRRRLQPSVLQKALLALVTHHDALRLRFSRSAQGEWQQSFAPPPDSFSLRAVELSSASEQQLPAALEAACADVQRSLRLDEGVLLRAALVETGPQRPQRLFLAANHLGVDAVSWRILLEDLELAVSQALEAKPVSLPPKSTSLKSWAERLQAYARSPELEKELPRWTALASPPLPAFPTDSQGTNTVASARTLSVSLEADTTRLLLQEAASAWRARPDELLLSSLAVALSRSFGLPSVLVDVEGHGREALFSGVDLSRTVGWFTSVAPVRLEVPAHASLGDNLRGVRDSLRALPQRGIGFGLLRYLGQPHVVEAMRALPTAPVALNYLGQLDASAAASSLFALSSEASGPVQGEGGLRSHLLELNAVVLDGRLKLDFIYSSNLHTAARVQVVAEACLDVLRQLVSLRTSADTQRYTPTDFPLATLDADTLARVVPAGTPVEDLYPLSPTQQGMLFHAIMAPGAGEYFEQMTLTFSGPLDVAAFRRAWETLVARHPVLRTRFLWEGLSEPHQLVQPRAELPWRQLDWRGLPADEQRARVEAFLAEDKAQGFELSQAPLARVALIQLDGMQRLVWSHHHLLMDGWSQGRLFQELFVIYDALTHGRAPRLDEAPPYRNYISWLRRQDYAAAERFWRERLAGFSSPTPLPGDREPGSKQALSELAIRQVLLSPQATAALGALTRSHSLTVSTVVQAAWALVLGRSADETDVVFGATVSGRPPALPGVEEMVGLFIGSLPVRVRLPGDAQVLSWLKGLQEQQNALRQFEYSPLAQVQGWSGVPRGTTLFNSLIVFENYPIGASVRQRATGLDVRDVEVFERSNYPLTATIVPGEQLLLKFSYDTGRFDAATVERLLRRWSAVLESFATAPEQPLANVSLLDAEERQRVLVEWNDTRVAFPGESTLHALFEEHVALRPDAVALESASEKLTYRQLDERANQLAHALRRMGVGPDARVALCLERSVDLIVCVLGILKAGGAYVPLDASYPQERLALMVEDARPQVLVTTRSMLERLPTASMQLLLLDEARASLAQEPTSAPSSGATARNLAYIDFTSGSTGRPKGVCIEHRSVARLVKGVDYAELGPQHTFLLIAPISFDASTLEIWGCLLNGARLVLYPPQAPGDVRELREVLTRHGVTTLHLTAGLFSQMVDADIQGLASVRQLLTGGDVVSAPHVRRVLSELKIPVTACYGPTESTTFTSCFRMTEPSQPGNSVPIGRPIANTQVYLLDGNGQPVPAGVPGELFVGGDGLARGYLDADLTAERFVPDPFGREPGGRLYRTGDLARWRHDGVLEFLGRRDTQVKVRGYRIEVGEIEAVLLRVPSVREAVVVAREDVPGVKRLVAYVVTAPGESVDIGALRDAVKDALPEYMVPAAFVGLDALPLTANGKVDRKALPAPTGERPEMEHAFVAPRTPVEEKLAAIWSRALGVQQVGIHDNFFTLGGDSIISLQVVARARQVGLQISPRQIFERQTIAELAAVLTPDTVSTQEEQGPVTGEMALTPIQRFFFERELPEPHHYNQSVLLVLRRRLEPSALQKALLALVTHHDALRLRFSRSAQGEWQQSFAPPPDSFSLRAVELSSASEQELPAALEAACADVQRSLRLDEGVLLRAALVETGPQRPQRLFVAAHHLVVDTVSWRILLEDLELAVSQALEAKPVSLPPKSTSLKSWAERLQTYARSPELEKELPRWTALASPPLPALPTDSQGANTVASARTLSVSLEADTTRLLLQEAASAWRARPDELLLSSLAVALSRSFGLSSVLVDVEGHGREALFSGVDLSRTVGWFTSVAPVRLEVPAHASLGDSLRGVRDSLRALPQRGIGFGLLRYLGSSQTQDSLRALPKAPVAFNYLGQLDASAAASSLFTLSSEASGPTTGEGGLRSHLIEFDALVLEGRLKLDLRYSPNLHTAERIQAVAEACLDVLRQLVSLRTSADTQRYTPTDFPLATLDAETLARVVPNGTPVEDLYPLSPTQQGMLFHTLLEPSDGDYFEQLTWRIRTPLDAAAFRRAWEALVARHAVFRTSFHWENLSEPHQLVLPKVELPWQELDWREVPEADLPARLDSFLRADRALGFDLSRPPLARVTTMRQGDGTWRVVFSHHHLLLDGWSQGRIFQELFSLYDTFARGETPKLPPVPAYQAYIAWLRRQDYGRTERFWRETLTGVTGPTPLPAALPTAIANAPKGLHEREVRLSRQATAALQSLARQHGLTLNTVVQGSWALMLGRYAGETDVVFGATVSGRPPELPGVEEFVGLFINTLPVRVSLPPGEKVLSWLTRLQAQQAALRQQEHSPLAQVQGWSGVPRGTPLFESILVFENYPIDEAVRQRAGGMELDDIHALERTNYALSAVVIPGNELVLTLSGDTRRFEASALERLLGQWRTALEGIAAQPEQLLADVPWLTAEQQKQLIVEWNDTRTDFPTGACVHQLFEAQAARTPDAVALSFEGAHLTYRELDGRANALAHALHRMGVGPEVRVGVCLERSLELVIALMGILKAGGAYVPLDPGYPRERLAAVLEDAGPEVILTHPSLAERLPSHEAMTLFLDATEVDAGKLPTAPPESGVTPENTAYVIFTSGSTGRPKGAMNAHAGVVNRLRWMQAAYGLGSEDSVVQKTPFSFDVSVWEFFWPLMTGARLLVARPGGHQDSAYLARLFQQERVTTVHFVPSMLAAFLEEPELWRCGGLRRVICSGEALPAEVAERCLERLGAELHNLYGPTEAAVDVTAWPVQRGAHPRGIPIGRPIANTRIHLLDGRMRPVPVGVAGELYIGGVQVGRGYQGRPDLTAERFVPDPYSPTPGARLYRTGDLARYTPEGVIEYLGRTDFQVKVRGFRIELGEIETVLGQHPSVRDCVVVARNEGGDRKRLVGYLVAKAGHTADIAVLRAWLEAKLPEHMVPSALVVMDALPLTSSGKVDRRALPAPGSQRTETERTYVAPRTPVEETLAAIWSKVLGVERVGVHDSFFELGGDSIISLQIVARTRQAGLKLTPRQLFERPTIAALAQVVSEVVTARDEQGPVVGPLPLTPIQRFFFERGLPHPERFTQSVMLELPRELESSRLEQALQAVVGHHDALRLCFLRTEAGWTQSCAAPGAKVALREVSLSGAPEAEHPAALATLAGELERTLSLEEGLLLRAALVRRGAGRTGRLLLVAHHLGVDAVSWSSILEDLETAYEQLARGAAVALPPKTTSVRTWAEKLAARATSQETEAELPLWKELLPATAQRLPVDRTEGANTHGSARTVTVTLGAEATQQLLKEVPGLYRANIDDVLLAALARGLSRHAGARVLVDVEGHGRESLFEDVDLSRTAGWFTSLTPLALPTSATPGEAVRAVRDMRRRMPHAGLGYGLLRYLGSPSARQTLAAIPSADVLFNYVGQIDAAVAGSRLFRPAPEPLHTGDADAPRSHLLEINGRVFGGRLELSWTYSENRHTRETAESLARECLAALEAIVSGRASADARKRTAGDFNLVRLPPHVLENLLADAGDVEDVYPLAPLQQGMLFHVLLAPTAGDYLQQLTWTVHSPLRLDVLRRAWQHVVDRHAVLRTGFRWEGLPEPLQVVHAKAELPWEELDWSGLTSAEEQARLESFLEEDRTRGFTLSKPPLMRVKAIRLAGGIHRFVWSFHHMLLDGWSIGIFFRELFSAYDALVHGRAQPRDEAPGFRDYIAWLSQHPSSASAPFWKSQLAGFSAPTPLPGRRPAGRAAHAHARGDAALVLSASTTAALQDFARQHQLTLNTLAQGTWAVLLGRHADTDDVVFGATAAGRPPELPGVNGMLGMFINSLPVRARLSPEQPLLPWLRELQATQLESRQHEHSPLVEVQGHSNVPRGQPLFESLLVFENYPVDAWVQERASGVDVRGVRFVERTTYPLSINVIPGTQLAFQVSYEQPRLDAATVDRMLGHWRTLLEGLVARPDARLGDLPLLGAEERRQVLVDWNRTGVAYPTDATVHGLFSQAAARTPEAVAVVAGEHTLTFEELDRRSNQLAHHLRSLGVGPEVRVGLFLDRSIELVVGLLGILKAGGAYVPMDASYPAERLAFLARDSGVPVLVTRDDLADLLPSQGELLVCMDSDERALSRQPTHAPETGVTSDCLAYVIYTSGSTGRPKGAMLPHRGVVNYLTWALETYRVAEGQGAPVHSSVSFDLTVTSLIAPLVAGRPVVLAREEDAVSALAETLRAGNDFSLVKLTPTHLKLLAEQLRPEELAGKARALVIGGEALTADAIRPWREHAPKTRLINEYGPTETVVGCSIHEVGADETIHGSVSIGRPIANTQLYVLDARLQPVPVGVPGELYIGGDGVGRGYLNRPELTADRFIPDAFSTTPGARMYRTGDRAVYGADGRLEYLGRLDEQVKIRGFRIEPGEVEAELLRLPSVAEAVVVAREDVPGDKRLVAYVVARTEGVTAVELRRHLEKSLPEHLVPAAFVLLDAVPLTPNGKVDKKALPAPESGSDEATFVAPRTPDEELLAGIWANVLHVERVGRHDDFFDLGGHSLLATQLVSRLRSVFGVELPLAEIFDAPTVEKMAERLARAAEKRGPVAPPLVAADRSGKLPLSFAQQRLWFLDQLEPGSETYNVPTALRLEGALDVSALEKAFAELVRRHESLRTTFPAEAGQPVQRISPPGPLPLPCVDLSALPEPQRDAEARRLAAAEARKPFSLAEGPLLRTALLRLGAEDHVLLLTMHHIVSDGWSVGVLVREMAALYAAFRDGQASPLPELTLQYADYAAWQQEWLRGEVLESQLDWWREQLEGAPAVLELPTDFPRPAVRSFKGATLTTTFPPEVAAAVRAFSQREGVTPFMTLLAAFQVLLSRYSGQDDIVVGTDIANRNRAETEGLIGFFVNQLVLRSRLDEATSFRSLLAQVRRTTLGAYARQDLPFEELVKAINPERSLGHAPLFQVKLVLQNAPMSRLEVPGLALSGLEGGTHVARFDMTLAVTEAPEGLAWLCEYSTELFEAATIERMFGNLRTLLEAAVARPDTALHALPLLTEAEQQALLKDWSTGPAAPAEAVAHQLFEAQAARTPDAIAVSYGDQRLTYRELDTRANQLANYLQARGVGPDMRVALCVGRSLDFVVSILGILKAGGAWLPLDPSLPHDRLGFMLQDAAPPVLVTWERLADELPSRGELIVCVDAEADAIARESTQPPRAAVGPEHLAYVIYTSGSTGRPKGTLLTHRGLCNTARAASGLLHLGPGKTALQFAAPGFDASVWETFSALLSGARLVLSDSDNLLPGDPLHALLSREAVTTVTLTPSTLARLAPESLPALETVAAAGEAVSPDLVRRWGPGRRFLNAYGPTEVAVCASVSDDVSPERPTIGRPLPGVEVYVLDERLQPVPAGIPGELLVGGLGLARAYLGRPELTADRFVPHPYSATPGARLYRTGDRVRWLKDGNLEFLGRADQQVKLRGFRIELGEVESVLSSHPSVAQAVAMVREDIPGDPRLIAWLVPHEGESVDASALRTWLQQRLPDYMVPSAFVTMAAFPLSSSDKVDRKALPAPDAASGREDSFVPPSSPTEELVAAIWSEVLHVESVGAKDDFFALGGHSLLATQLISRIRDTFRVELQLREFFESPTLSALAARIDAAVRAGHGLQAPPLVPVSREGTLPLSFSQQRLWFIDQLEPGSAAYNIPSALRLTGTLDAGALERAFTELVRRHEALRTRFVSVNGQAAQHISPPAAFPLATVDLTALPAETREAEAHRIVGAEAVRPFDLARGPLLRANLLRLGTEDHVLMLVMHHIVSDGWSMGVLVRELTALYAAFTSGRPSPLPELSVQYADFAAWQRNWLQGEALATQLGWWREQLDGAPPLLELPTDFPRPAEPTYRGARFKTTLPRELSEALRTTSRRESTTLFSVLLAAYQAWLSRLSGQRDVVVGTVIAQRNQAKTEDLIGFFVNQLALRARLDDDPTVRQMLARTHETVLAAHAHQELPFEELVKALNPERSRAHAPIFQVQLVLQNTPPPILDVPGVSFSPVELDTASTRQDLLLSVMETEQGLSCTWEYDRDLFEAATIERWVASFQRVLETFVNEPGQRLSRLRMLSDEEQRQLLVQWNDTARPLADAPSLHGLVEAAATRTPDAIALEGGERQVRYGELDRRANQVARALRQRGVKAETPVVLCAEPTPDFVVGLLGILKAGGVYVPLDPTLPRERGAALLEDTRPAVILTQQRFAQGLAAAGAPLVVLDEEGGELSRQPETSLDAKVLPGQLAYVIFTSGSTGTPKGTLLEHRGAVNTVMQAARELELGPGRRVLQNVSMAFDVSVMEIFSTLSAGATLVLVPPEQRIPGTDLQRVLGEHRITNAVLTPSMLSVLDPKELPELVTVLTGGEACPPELADRWSQGRRVVNQYGPTETTVCATSTVHVPGSGRLPIGRAYPNTRLYVLDEALQPVPAGVAGELYIGGAGVARGYLRRPELTAERFVPDPFSTEPGARLYRTGDKVRMRLDGNLEFLGRLDFQVKLRGFRIELGEIESVLASHPAVEQAVVVVREDAPGDKRLVAYVKLRESLSGGTTALRAAMKERLPGYMVPSAIVVLDAFPLNRSGKVDRKALPAPEADARRDRPNVAPRNETEQQLVSIFSELLGVSGIGIHDDFFELGGHSLLATRAAARISSAFDLELPVRTLFDNTTVENLAVRILELQAEQIDLGRLEELMAAMKDSEN